MVVDIYKFEHIENLTRPVDECIDSKQNLSYINIWTAKSIRRFLR